MNCSENWMGVSCVLSAGHKGPHVPETAVRKGMTDWQKFALLIFALVVLGGIAFVWMSVNAGINSMI